MIYTTSDMATAAYLLMRGLRILSAERAKGKFIFTFDDKNNEAFDLEQAYLRTEHPNFDAAMRKIKRMLNEPRAQSKSPAE